MKLMKVLLVLLGILTAGTLTAIDSAKAGSKFSPAVEMNELSILSSPDSLFVEVAYTPGTVANPTTPVLNNVNWFRNSVLVDSLRDALQTRDTLRLGRAPLGGTDTVSATVFSTYLGRVGPSVSAQAVFDNPDLQIPGAPTIVSVDTTCAGSATCP